MTVHAAASNIVSKTIQNLTHRGTPAPIITLSRTNLHIGPGSALRYRFGGAALRHTLAPTKSKVDTPPFPTRIDIPRTTSMSIGAMAKLQAKLGTQGRTMPPMTPQVIGVYCTQVLGDWSVERPKLPDALLRNLGTLDTMPAGSSPHEVLQMQKECTAHWHQLSEVETSHVLNNLGTSGLHLLGNLSTDENRTPVRDFLEHKLATMSPAKFDRLKQSLPKDVAEALASCFNARYRADELAAVFKPFRCDLPIDHLYPYADFLEKTNDRPGELPADKRGKVTVGIMGGGPSGLIAAYHLNLIGAVPTVFEQAKNWGGRMVEMVLGKSIVLPGAMRYAPDTTIMHYIKKSGEPLQRFGNVADSATMFLAGDREPVLKIPGKPTGDELFDKVTEQYDKALKDFLDPFEHARAAGDTATLRELWQTARDELKDKTYLQFISGQMEKLGFEFGPKEKQIAGVSGQGVGGYGDYYQRGALSPLRFKVDGRLDNHHFLPNGSSKVLQHLIETTDGLPPGGQSLAQRGAIVTQAAYESSKPLDDGSWSVAIKDKQSGGVIKRTFDWVLRAFPIPEHRRLGTTNQDNAKGVMSSEVVQALETVKIDSATKVMWTVPREALDGANVPLLVQSTKAFKQLYVVPPNERSPDYQVHAYPLGDGSTGSLNFEKQDLVKSVVSTLRSYGTASENGKKLTQLADAIEPKAMEDVAMVPWGRERHFGGAFKMNDASQEPLVDDLWESTSAVPEKTQADFMDQFSNEDGFASGAATTAVNTVLAFVEREGGTTPPNSPLHQAKLYT